MKWKTIICSTAATLLLAGCVSPQPVAQPAPQVDVTNFSQVGTRWVGTRFEDIPVPAEFVLDYEVSYMDASPRGPRIADLRYLGESSPSEVLNRIQPAMSKAGWQSTSLTGAAIKTLRYVKGREECVLVIHKKAVGGGTIIMVRVHPRPSG